MHNFVQFSRVISSSVRGDYYRADHLPLERWRPFTLQLLVFGTASLAHPVSASGRQQMFLNNFSHRWKFLPFAAEPRLALHFLPIQTRRDMCAQFFFSDCLTWKTASRGGGENHTTNTHTLTLFFPPTHFICPQLKNKTLTWSWKVACLECIAMSKKQMAV